MRGAPGAVAIVGPAERVRDVGPAREFDGQRAGQGEDVRLRYVRVLLVHLVEHVADDAEARVRWVGPFGLEPHRAAVRSARPVPGVEGPGRVPRHAARDGKGDHLVVQQGILDVALEVGEPSGVDHGDVRGCASVPMRVCRSQTCESAKRPCDFPRDTQKQCARGTRARSRKTPRPCDARRVKVILTVRVDENSRKPRVLPPPRHRRPVTVTPSYTLRGSLFRFHSSTKSLNSVLAFSASRSVKYTPCTCFSHAANSWFFMK